MIRRPPRSTRKESSAASDVYKRQTEASVVPKVEKKITKQQQIEIDQIKEMFDIGALTKEEYDNAIKRILN